MSKKKITMTALAALLIISAAGFFLKNITSSKSQQPQSTEALQTTVSRMGDLTLLASGTGSIVPAKEINLGFDEAGTLLELDVQEGDEVQAGDILARLQTARSEEEINASTAEADLAVVQAQNALDRLYQTSDVSRTEALNNIAAYSTALRDAQYALENYSTPTYLQNLDTVDAIAVMKKQLDQALLEFEPYRYHSRYDDDREDKLKLLNEAQARYDAAVDRLNLEYTLEVAEANLAKAQQDYDKYKDGPAFDELTEAKGTLMNAKAKLALAQADQAILELAAPFDGTILSADAIVGGTVGEESIITLGVLKPITLDVYLDESDLQMVKVGYSAEVIFDAYPDKVFKGEVIQISRSLQTVSEVSAIRAEVQVDSSELDSSITLPVGLNASVDVIAGRATNVVLVPIEALRELGDGEYAVFVVEDGIPQLRPVTVGLTDATFAEITSGLEAGQTISTGTAYSFE